jgi:hypothetical protein
VILDSSDERGPVAPERLPHRSTDRQVGVLMVLVSVISLAQRAAIMLLDGSVELPTATSWTLAVSLGGVATGVALWRGSPWARWSALATWLVVAIQAATIVWRRGVTGMSSAEAAVIVGALVLLGLLVASLWRRDRRTPD